ncbi:hypothetical protein JM93_02893 [Roseibium hamelinense]|uniref:Uncharacterized protein n=1 Tax=Roseibium hamelinense TaxID=150831 RepID=A0A562SXS8_9HYPH|nr:DUF6665 family protein [Roseibium hamelinense]MTI43668.1 hypothetical protein [Roseibium hamelinense]TWI86185.1 hypothetical protein JM93_02893 [Roseibium hamelinense]
MSVRPPKQYTEAASDPVTAALEQEILEEKAGTLARLNRKLEQALVKIPSPDSATNADGTALRERRVAEAAEALWHVQIQRELCGLTGHKSFYDHMGVPMDVRLRIGPVPRHLKSTSSGG